MDTTGADADQARFLLEAANGSFDVAAHMYFGATGGGGVWAALGEPGPPPPPLAQPFLAVARGTTMLRGRDALQVAGCGAAARRARRIRTAAQWLPASRRLGLFWTPLTCEAAALYPSRPVPQSIFRSPAGPLQPPLSRCPAPRPCSTRPRDHARRARRSSAAAAPLRPARATWRRRIRNDGREAASWGGRCGCRLGCCRRRSGWSPRLHSSRLQWRRLLGTGFCHVASCGRLGVRTARPAVQNVCACSSSTAQWQRPRGARLLGISAGLR
jgi:hypothetical protein